MKKITTLVMALGVVFMGAFMFNDAAEARMGRPGPCYYGETMGQGADLTEAQQKKLSTLVDEHHAAMTPIHQKLVQKEAELRLATVSDPVDAQKVTTITKEIGELRGQLINGRIALDEKLSNEGLSNARGCYGGGGKHFGRGMGRGHGYGHGYGHGGYNGHGMRHYR